MSEIRPSGYIWTFRPDRSLGPGVEVRPYRPGRWTPTRIAVAVIMAILCVPGACVLVVALVHRIAR